jgi:hypothetical protein
VAIDHTGALLSPIRFEITYDLNPGRIPGWRGCFSSFGEQRDPRIQFVPPRQRILADIREVLPLRLNKVLEN